MNFRPNDRPPARTGGTVHVVEHVGAREPTATVTRRIAEVALVAVAYFVGARLGLRLAFDNHNVTSVWPPTGIAIAALVLFGRRVWPGIAVGALVANLSNGAGLVTSLGITVGNTLAPVVAAWLLEQFGFQPMLERVRDVILLVAGAGAASMLLSATGGTTTLAATGHLGHSGYGLSWLVWWAGDALGVVLFAPPILAAVAPGRNAEVFRREPMETAALFGATALATWLVFSTHVPLPHLLYPLVIWAALRFQSQGVALTTLVLSVIAIAETVAGHGPFSMLSRTTNLLALQAFNGSVALTGLSLAALTVERRRAHVALEGEREVARQLKVIDEFKDSLLTAVSHELRTPLTIIIGLASTLRNPELHLTDAEMLELVTRLESNAQRLDRLLMDLLDVDRLNRRVIEPYPRLIGLREAVIRVLEALQVERHPVTVDIASEKASVDPAHLERIVENLISNAAKHTPPNTRIWVKAATSNGWVTLAIEDEGPGVPEVLRTEVFEPFRRGHVDPLAPGTGVGLSLVARFAALNGGRAWVEDRDGGGASFRVSLPSGHLE